MPVEIRKIMPGLKGKRVVHLFCNDGREVLSLERLGAHATGVDFSGPAIAWALRTRSTLGFDATFYCEEVLRWLSACPRSQFDIIYLSQGSLWWIADLERFLFDAARILKPNGALFWIDFHPTINDFDKRMRLLGRTKWHGQIRKQRTGIVDYVGDTSRLIGIPRTSTGIKGFNNRYPVYEFIWSTHDITQSAAAAGLEIARSIELPYLVGERWFLDMKLRKGYQYWPSRPLQSPLTMVLKMKRRPAP